MSSIGLRNRIFRIGVESGSSNQREEARGFSQVNAGLLFPRIQNQGQRTEDRGSRKRFRNHVLNLRNSREKAEGQRKAVNKEHSTPPTKESWPKRIRLLLHTTDSQMPDHIRLFQIQTIIPDRDQSSEPQYRARHEGAVRRHAEPVLTHQQRGTEIVLSISLLGVQRKCQTGPIASTSNGSRRSRSKALPELDPQ